MAIAIENNKIEGNIILPGKTFSSEELKIIIEKSMESGIISLEEAHQSIRDKYKIV